MIEWENNLEHGTQLVETIVGGHVVFGENGHIH
jgi:hypothetical protein